MKFFPTFFLFCFLSCSHKSIEVPVAEPATFLLREPNRGLASDNQYSDVLKSRPVFSSSNKDWNSHVNHSLAIFGWRYGVSERALRLFHHWYIVEAELAPAENIESYVCVSRWRSGNVNNEAFLSCVKDYGAAGLNTKLYAALFEYKSELLKTPKNEFANYQRVALIQYVEDLIRQNRVEHGLAASWFEFNGVQLSRFFEGEFYEFPHQDGDLVLSMGSSSISALIPNSTWPGRRFAHAYIIHNPDGIFRTAEALIETGVITQDINAYKKHSMANLLVSRWKGDPKVPARAASLAYSKVGFPYNIAMDFSNKNAFFCNQLIIHSYSEASKISQQKLVPSSSEIVSGGLLNYLGNLGVKKRLMPSPGDFMDSPYFTPVAEFRDADDLYRAWEMLLMGDIFVERLTAGYDLTPSAGLGVVVGLLGGVNSFLDVADLGFIPDGLTPKAVKYMKVQEDLFQQVWKAAEEYRKSSPEFNQRSIRSVPPWILRARLSWAVQEKAQSKISDRR